MKYIAFVIIAMMSAAKALDVSIEEVVCDESLDVTAIIQMECNGGRRCAFGATSRLYGTRKITMFLVCFCSILRIHLISGPLSFLFDRQFTTKASVILEFRTI
jgi:hypothetical protein